MANKKPAMNSDFDREEVARRRDAVVRRMVNTPPQPKATPRPKKKKIAAPGRAARKKTGGAA